MRDSFQDSDGNVSIEERKPLQQELAGRLHALSVGSPVLETVIAEFAQKVETFRRGDIPIALFFYFREDPGFVESASGDHNAIDLSRSAERGGEGEGEEEEEGEHNVSNDMGYFRDKTPKN